MSLDKSRRILLRRIVPDATHDVPVLIEAVNLLAYEVGSGWVRLPCLAVSTVVACAVAALSQLPPTT